MTQLIMLDGALHGKAFLIPDEGLLLGQGDACALRLEGDDEIAERHAEISQQDGHWILRNLVTTGLTLLNETPIDAAILTDGDRITLGRASFQFAAGAAEASPMADDDLHAIEDLNHAFQAMRRQLGAVIVGQEEVIEQLLMAILCRGHALLIGAPGLAKTLLVSSLSEVLELGFRRVQFTPDLMPTDITGTDVLEEDPKTGQRSFRFVRGPIFANLLLADEINRTPPKTQAALLEAMQERHVTVGESTYDLPDPFFVLATQNPIEQEGTFPLPEAQLDRFLFNIRVDYPSAAEEEEIIKRVTGSAPARLESVLTGEQLIHLQSLVKRVPVSDHVVHYASRLVRATRPSGDEAPAEVKEMVSWGAGPRAGISLIAAAKAHAVLQGRYHASTSDVNHVALPVLRHRILTTFHAEASGIDSDDIVKLLMDTLRPARELKHLRNA